MAVSVISSQLSSTVADILNRALDGQDISPNDGITLLNQTNTDVLEAIRATADRLRQQHRGDTVTYIVNRNVNYTNICEQHCSFCAFRRDEGQPGAYWLSWEAMAEKAAAAVAQGATEIRHQLNHRQVGWRRRDDINQFRFFRRHHRPRIGP